ETGSGAGEGRFAALAALFASDDDAMNAAASINATLEEAALEADRLFAGRGGVAESAELDRIYGRFGLRNTSGWRQERPLAAAGHEVLWQLPAGAPVDEAEQLLLSHGAKAVRVIDRFDEGWKVAPHPLAIPFVDEESGEVFYDLVKVEDAPHRGHPLARKRTLH
ncbi:MAG TPA: hypothetical protein VM285_15060, partial [Polyangia bacterium]|nr:hypothetical protein [Polyangia bacterium]